MRKSSSRGFSLVEVGVLLAILALLFALGIPAYVTYRGHQVVNRALEIAEGLAVRAKEEAKSSGFALPDKLRDDGVSAAASGGRKVSQGSLSLRLRKRFRAGEAPLVVTERELSSGRTLEYEISKWGIVDLDADPALEGVYLELLDGGVLVAALPIDANGEFYLHGNENTAAIRFLHGDYSRTLELTRRGVARPDGR